MADNDKLIYIGPRLSRGRLQRYTVYIGGYPTHLVKEFAACPQLKRLFVPLADKEAAVKATQTAGTPLNKYYKMAMEV